MSERPDLRDGRWHTGEPGQATAHVKNKWGHVTARLVWRARIFRWVAEANRHDQDVCPHNHYKRSVARQCGERAARRNNRLYGDIVGRPTRAERIEP